MARAKFILDWIKNFTKSADGKTILRARVMIRIFVATFWEGEPRPKTQSSTTFAYIELGVNGGLAYCEKYKWHPAHEMRKWVLPIRPTSLARFFHPQYLEEWEAAIRSGDVWKYIKNSL